MESEKITYLDQKTAQLVDQDLMNKYGYSIDTLMELAGMSVAQAIYNMNMTYQQEKIQKVLVLCGPGNNGGDGYVAARHLKFLGINSNILIFKKPEKALYKNLIQMCESNEIAVMDYNESTDFQKDFVNLIDSQYDLVVDAIFGFSFQGALRNPYDIVIGKMKNLKVPIFSIDIPSGWDVEKGPGDYTFYPSYVISLTLPKLCMKNYKGIHYLGGRFVPKVMIKEYDWKIPEYQSLNHFIDITKL